VQSITTLPGAVAAARVAAPVESVPIKLLKPADSPRLHGIVLEHVRHLASSGAQSTPILVHRETMRVIDGMHRLRVAQIKGEAEIQVAYFDGDAEDAFIQAVVENNTRGLPLQLSDRKAAALRILTAHPDWSDRSIGKTAHLSAKTVALIRRAAGPRIPQPTARLGQDGRAHCGRPRIATGRPTR
jgi:ParB-like chromosome segregation protein Spo0J